MRNGNSTPPAFTLIELLVVLGLIVTLLTLAVAAFNALTGNRSVEASKNILSAMISQARLSAINNNIYTGVAIFPDPNNPQRCLATFVTPASYSFEADPYDNYKSYNPGFAYSQGQRVVFPVQYKSSATSNKWFMAIFVRNGNNLGTTGQPPPTPVGPNTSPASFSNNYWSLYIPTQGYAIDMAPGVDVQPLSLGVGVRTINDQTRGTGSLNTCRYVPLGVIFFDSQGRLACISYSIAAGSTLGNAIGLQGSYPGTTGITALDTTVSPAYSDFGLAMFDQTSFNNQGTAPYAAAGDTWIDGNGQVYTVDRFNGQLVTTP